MVGQTVSSPQIWKVLNSLCLLAFGLCIVASKLSAEQPNIVIYLSDDHSQYDSELYGAPDIPTPNVQKMAAQGMVFSHAFVASPSCAPSRAAMLTGLMPARNGAEANHTYPKPGTHFLTEDLKNVGYEVVAFGKVGHGKNQKQFGFDSVKPAASFQALQKNVAQFLNDRRSKKPLCLFVGISNPHVPWPQKSSFDPADVQFPPIHLDTPATRIHRAAYYQEIKEVDLLMGKLRELSAKHLGENTLFIHSSDHGSQWPFGKWTLYDYGIRVPFIATWPGKIEPGSKSDAMTSWIDMLPTVLELAGGKTPHEIDGQSFAQVLLGQREKHRKLVFTTNSGDGRMNVYPIRSVRSQQWKLIHNLHPDFAFTNHSDLHRKELAGAYWSQWVELAKTDARAKRTVDRYYRRPEWELFHVSKDKWEEQNLIDDPKNTAIIAQLKSELAQWMKDQGDKETVFNKPRLLSELKSWHLDFDNRQKPKSKRRKD